MSRVLLLLIVAAVIGGASLSSARAQTLSTQGSCSSIVTDVTGNVSINCYLSNPDQIKFRIAYYRMRAIALSFFVNGTLLPKWKRHLGEQQAIIENDVFKETERFLKRFATPLNAFTLDGSVPFEGGEASMNVAEYVKQIDPTIETMRGDFGEFVDLNDPKWSAYLGGDRYRLFVPDLDATDTLFNSERWPDGYHLSYGEPPGFTDEGKGSVSAPLLWRFLTQEDIDRYEERYTAYHKRVSERAYPGGYEFLDWQNAQSLNALESLRYLTKGGLPDKFMVVEGLPAGHEGWSFTAPARQIELLIAVVENTTDKPIKVGPFGLRAIKSKTLRLYADTNAELDAANLTTENLFPPGTLLPSEKIVLPLRIELHAPVSDEYYDSDEIAEIAANGEAVRHAVSSRGSKAVSVLHRSGDLLFSKPAAAFIPGAEPERVERYEYGPAWRVETIEVDGRAYELRQHDPNNFVLLAGFAPIGSCPYVFSFLPDSGLWVNEGHFLLGATAPDKKRTDTVELAQFNGRIQIRELEHEVAFVDQVALRVTLPGGEQRTFSPADSRLRATDGEEIVLRYGEHLDLRFDMPSNVWKRSRVELVATGFYVPLDSTLLVRRTDGN